MNWTLAGSLQELKSQVNALWPRRDKSWDGTIGDELHAARVSDHNPNARGIVTAMDVTHDPKNGPDGNILSERLRLSRDPRIKYVIWNKRIFSSTTNPWSWRPYDGSNPHDHHVHVSVNDDVADSKPWKLT